MLALCPLCMGKSVLIWSKEKFQLYQFPVKISELPHSFNLDLKLHFCETCSHSFLDPTPDDETLNQFYSNGYSSYTSPLMTKGLTASINKPAADFIASSIMLHFQDKKVKITEVGGFDGSLLKELSRLASDMLLIEASKEGASIAKQNGLRVRQQFLDQEVSENFNEKFNVVICRHVIEHVREPGMFLKNLVNLMAPDGILIIETPDLGSILERTLVRTVTLQHLHLFSPRSLRFLMRKTCDLEITNISFPLDYAVIVSATPSPEKKLKDQSGHLRTIDQTNIINQNAKTFSSRLEMHNNKLKHLINGWVKSSKRIWIWGAGTAAGELFNVYGQKQGNFQGYIDSDEKKTTMRFSCAPDLPILTPEQAYEKGVDSILITSFSVQEIIQSIALRGWNVEVADLYSCKKVHFDGLVRGLH